jgi:hypothetical protein
MNASASTGHPPAPAPSAAATEGLDIPWFIFTNRGRGYCVEAGNVSKAVAKWRKLNQRTDAGEIIAVIHGSGRMESYGRIVNTPIFGVVVCVEQTESGADKTRAPHKGDPDIGEGEISP